MCSDVIDVEVEEGACAEFCLLEEAVKKFKLYVKELSDTVLLGQI